MICLHPFPHFPYKIIFIMNLRFRLQNRFFICLDSRRLFPDLPLFFILCFFPYLLRFSFLHLFPYLLRFSFLHLFPDFFYWIIFCIFYRFGFQQKRTFFFLLSCICRIRNCSCLNQFRLKKPSVNSFVHYIVNFLLTLKAKLHFCRVNIYVNKIPFYLEMKNSKRKFMLHRKIFISVFQRLRKHRTFYITAVHKEIFKIPVSSGDDRFT